MSTCQQCASMASTITALRGQLRRLKHPKKNRWPNLRSTLLREEPPVRARSVPERTIWSGQITDGFLSIAVGQYTISGNNIYRLNRIVENLPQWTLVRPALVLQNGDNLPGNYEGLYGDLAYYPDFSLLYEWTAPAPGVRNDWWRERIIRLPVATPTR